MVGISFKISKVGKKYLPKLQQEHNSDGDYTGLGKVCFECKRCQSGSGQPPSLICGCQSNASLLHTTIKGEACLQEKEGKSPRSSERKYGQEVLVKMTEDISGCLSQNRTLEISEDEDISFAVNLFANGFSIGKPSEKGKSPPMVLDVMDLIYPYNRTSEGFLMALNGGWLPGDILDEIPCRYINGCAICELRDYRNSIPPGFNDAGPASLLKLCEEWFPIVHRILLRPSTQTIVKDIACIVNETCSFNNLMEVESRVFKTVHPELNLDPKADTCEKNETSSWYNIIKSSISQNGRLMDRRMRAVAVRAMVTTSSLVKNKKISFEKGSDGSMSQSETETTLTCNRPPFSLEDKTHLSSSSTRALKSSQDTKRAGISTRPRNGPCIRVIQSPSCMNPITQFTQSLVSAIPGDSSIPSRLGTDAILNMPPLHGNKDDGEISTQDKFDEDAMQCDNSNHYQLNHLQSVDSNSQRCGLKPCPQVENQETSYLGSNQKADLVKLCQFTERIKEENPKSESEELSKQGIRQHCSQNISNGTRGKQIQVNSDNESKKPEIPLKRKRSPSPKVFQKADAAKFSLQSPANSAANASVGSPGVASSTPCTGFGQTKDSTQMVTSSGHNHSNIMMQLSRRRTKSLMKTPSNLSSAASPRSATNASRNSGPTDGSKSMSSAGIKTEPPIIALGPRKDLMDRMLGLVSTAQRHGLTTKKCKEEELPEIEKTQPSWQLLSIALADTAVNDFKESKGQRKMADSFVGGNVNAQKSRLLQFQRIEHIFQGPGIPFIAVHHICIRLLMCEQAKDAMVEAVVQFGDDRDDESLNSMLHYYLPTMPNAFAADHFAKQFCQLMEKDGFNLVDDQIQAVLPRTSASSNTASTSQSISTTGNSTIGPQLASTHSMFSQQLTNTIGNVSAMSSMQTSPSRHTKSILSLSGNNPSQKLPSNYLGHINVSLAKPLLFEGSASQLAILQRQHLAQLSAPSYNSEQLQQLQIMQQQSLSMDPRKVMVSHRRGNLDNINSANNVGIPFSTRTQGGTVPMIGLSRMSNAMGVNGMSASISNISNLVDTDFGTQRQPSSRPNIMMGGQPIHLVANINSATFSKAHFMEGKGSTCISTTQSNNQLESLSRPLGMESVQNSNIGSIGETRYLNPQQQLDPQTQLIIKQQHINPHIHYAVQQQLLNSQNHLNTQLNPEHQPSKEQMGSLDLGVVGPISPQLSSHTF